MSARNGPRLSLPRQNPAEDVLPRVRHDAGAQAPSPPGQHAVEEAVDRDDNHETRTLIAVPDAENHRLPQESHDGAPRERLKLTHQVSPEDRFLAYSG